MAMQTKLVIDGKTNTSKVADFTVQDMADQKVIFDAVALQKTAEQTKADAKLSGQNKLIALGITLAEQKAMFQ